MATEIHGMCETEFQAVKDAFTSGFEKGLETGASVAVIRGDQFVVDLWAGYTNDKHTRPWKQDTLVFLASTSKIMTTLCALMLIDQGKLDPERPVVEYWPEFGKHGKDKVLAKHIFAHTAGIPGFSPPIPWKDATVWEGAIKALEDRELWWEPGTQVGYHAETFGFLAGELVRRISGLTPGKFLREHIASKIDADVWMGIPQSEFRRISQLVRNDEGMELMFEPGSMFDRVMNCYLPPMWEIPESLTSEFPGANCLANAHGMAQIGAIYANHGEYGGCRFLTEKTLDFALTEQSYSVDVVVEEKIRRGFGLGLNSEEFPCPSDQTLHWGGRGGSFLMMDLASRTCLAYAPNNWMAEGFHGDPRNTALQNAYYQVLAA